MYPLNLLLLLCCITRIQPQPTRDAVTQNFQRVRGAIQNFIPGNNKQTGRVKRPKPSYGAPKPSSGAPKPSYKPTKSNKQKPRYKQQLPKNNRQKPRNKQKPSYKPRKPGYKNPSQNLSPPSSPNPQTPSLSQYNPTQPNSVTSQPTSSLTDQQMMTLILSMHSMMQQIVANQATSSAEGVDSYGTPQGSPLGSSASSSTVLSQGRSPAVLTTANTNTPTQPQSNYNGPQPSYSNQATFNSANINDPVIKSTLEQIARTLAEYEPDKQKENIIVQEASGNKAGYKPVRFPRNPTVQDILAILEGRNHIQDPEKEVAAEGISKRKGEIPDLKIETFF
eukprot:GFUD01017631.1.p1 GENE.GFUD01017631.1~~GFUD01017631.1.p1  ORF type:complete len:336 (-),score=66.29 GFUD01017631.1:90-1097(-)